MFVLTLWSVRVTIVAMDVSLHVAVNSIKPLSVMETQERVPFAVVELPNISYCHQQYTHLGIHVTCQTLLSDFNHIWSSSTNFRTSPNIKFYYNPSSGSRADICERTDGRDKANRCFSLYMRTHLKILVSTAEYVAVYLLVIKLTLQLYQPLPLYRLCKLLRAPLAHKTCKYSTGTEIFLQIFRLSDTIMMYFFATLM